MFKRKYYKIKIVNLYWIRFMIIFNIIKFIMKLEIKYNKILKNILNMENTIEILNINGDIIILN